MRAEKGDRGALRREVLKVDVSARSRSHARTAHDPFPNHLQKGDDAMRDRPYEETSRLSLREMRSGWNCPCQKGAALPVYP